MINGLLHFFSQKKKLFCIQEYKKPISLQKRKKRLFETCTAFILLPFDFFIFSAARFFLKTLNFINLSSTGLCIGC